MKRTITISGIGHKKGTSREKKPYDMHVISGFYEDSDYSEGTAACEMPIPDEYIPKLAVGQSVTVYFHYFNNRIYVDAILF